MRPAGEAWGFNIIAHRFSGSLLGWDMRASSLESGLLDPSKSTLKFDHKSGSREERIGPFSYFSKVPMRHRSHGRFWV
jgi:hypothetical protein